MKAEIKTTRGLKYVFGKFQKTSILNDFTLDINPIRELKNKVPELNNFPFNLKENEAIISYKVKGIIKYYKIENIKKAKEDTLPKIQ
jgi:hypothetical protein